MGLPVADVPGAGATTAAAVTNTVAKTTTNVASIAASQGIATADMIQKKVGYGTKLLQWLEQKGRWGVKTAQFLKSMSTKYSLFATKMAAKRSQFFISMARFISMYRKFMAMIAKFMPIIKVMMIVILIFTNLLKYIMLIIAGIIIGLIYVVYFILDLPVIRWIPIFIYWWISSFVPFVFFCIIYTIILVAILIMYGLLTLLNMILGGSLNNLLFCENNPSAWYTQENFHLMNRFSRGLFCSKPCMKGYAPDVSGSFCKKQPSNTPDFCPQAEIMRIYSGKNRRDKKYTFPDYQDKGNLKFMSSSPEERERLLFDHFWQQDAFFNICEDKMNPYKNITLDICSNIDTLKNNETKGLTSQDIDRLKRVCSQSFCSPSTSYPFCTSMNIQETDSETLIQLIVKFVISMIVFLIILNVFFKLIEE